MRRYFYIIMALTMSACSNPFYSEYTTPYGAPPFGLIKLEHYLPAFEKGIKEQTEEVDLIANNAKAPDFKNTIEALENTGKLLDKVSLVFFNLNEADGNQQMDEIASKVSVMLSNHEDNILLNEKLFARVKAVYDKRDSLTLDVEQRMLLRETYTRFVRGGANLSLQAKEELRSINEKLSLAVVTFGQNSLADVNNYRLVVDTESELGGLPASLKSAAAATAAEQGLEGKWVFTLKNPSLMPFLQYADNRELRRQMQQAYAHIGNNANDHDNKKLVNEIVNLRLRQAQLLGYDTYAGFVLDHNMAKTPANVYKMLGKLWTPALDKGKQEARQMQDYIKQEAHDSIQVQAWDWRYYAEKIRQRNYQFDEEALRPYFKLDNVIKGVFVLMDKLYGVTFEEQPDVPVYHKDVVCYAAKDAQGQLLGLIYMDFFPRAGKRSGAWMTNFREQSRINGQRVLPIISLVCNFSAPLGDTPSLLTVDEVETFFHEFGHATHSLFSQCTYQSLAGTNVYRDFVELPSQIMENWALEPELLSQYALHYQTNEVLPVSMVNTLRQATAYGQGFKTVEYLAASWLDMDYHTLKTPQEIDVERFEQKSMGDLGLIPQILPRYRSTYFNHIFAGGYAAGYYSYIWAEMLDADAYAMFKSTGNIFDPVSAAAFRTYILEKGGTEDPMELYKRFRGQEPGIEPLIKRRGLN